MKRQEGFTLAEIMIVVAIIGLLASIAIPNLFRARVNANEGAVKGDLRTFSSANEAYRTVQTPPTYAPNIAALGAATPAYLDTTWTIPSPKHGFLLTYNVAAAPAGSYALLAAPAPGAGTINTYCVDQSATIVGATGGVTGPATGCVGGVPIG